MNWSLIRASSFISITAMVIMVLASSNSVAHEPRVIADGALNVVVGWRSEPAYAGQANAFDFIVTDDITVDDPDLTVKILYLKEDTVDADVLANAELTGDLRRDRANPNRFNIPILLAKPGAYGFHIMGMVNGLMVDEIFICRGGSQNMDGRSFGCGERLQKFPRGNRKNSEEDDDD